MKTVTNNFQRAGSKSNSDVGRQFESLALAYFKDSEGLILTPNFPVLIGAGRAEKSRSFDLGANNPPVLVECKCHKWTDTGKVPSAKLRDWIHTVYRLQLAPAAYRKILFVARDIHPGKKLSLADYYLKNYLDFVPTGVSIVEFDEQDKSARTVTKS